MAKSCGLKKQIRQVNPKMGFIGGPNMALENLEFKDQFGLICEGRKEPVEREREEQRREEKKKKKERRSSKPKVQKTSEDFRIQLGQHTCTEEDI